MKLSQLKMLVAVADHGSFSAAAAELSCTQSRISHGIAELEGELGVSLLARGRAGSAPTEAGQRVVDKARQMLRLERGLIDAARADEEVSGTVRIACFRSVGTHLLPHVLEALAQSQPRLRVEIDDSCEERADVTRALQDGLAQIGIAQLPLGAGLDAYPYLHDDYVLVVPAALALPAMNTSGWPELGALPFITLACSGAAEILARCRAAGFAPEPGRVLANDTSIAAMVGRGMGYAILPRLATFPEALDVRILSLPIPARRQFAIAGLPGVLRQRPVRAVVRALRERSLAARTGAGQAGIIGWE
ncbi:LysR family transcriptional regulator [Massilia sp. IC2-476]|uniref:LysR family transcriptional regulator n=1 Tax=Massilia sp. IC2-476 TaxID=2887199 RepID=UPI001D126743|nr:LysR family transcriptional regulator [Massilia sp. IC2-476]MCC2970962.1 LysR family transcriptional regulator [Massilia sp. IC2-476]